MASHAMYGNRVSPWPVAAPAVEMEQESPEIALRVANIKLQRLLHCMESNELPANFSSWEPILDRANMARLLWQQVQDGYNATAHVREQMTETNLRLDEEEWVRLQQRVDRVCLRAQELAAIKRQEGNLIDEIFFSSAREEEDDQIPESDVVDDVVSDATSNDSEDDINESDPRKSADFQRSSSREVEELQKEQREQLEKEISQMTAQLKQSTKSMHSKLQDDVADLGEMEELATDNVDKVTKVTDDVTDHRRKQWRNTFATFTMILTILGTFCFCVAVMRVVPKRKNACLFFCPAKQKPAKIINEEVTPATKSEETVATCEIDENGECIDHVEIYSVEDNTSADEELLEDQQWCASGDQECVNNNSGDADATTRDEAGSVKSEEVVAAGEQYENEEVSSEENNIPDDADLSEAKSCSSGENDCRSDGVGIQKEEVEPDENACVGNECGTTNTFEDNGKEQHEMSAEESRNEPQHDAKDTTSETPNLGTYEESQPEDEESEEEEDFGAKVVRRAAALNMIDRVKRMILLNPEYAHMPDQNGWQPIHEAARKGHTEVVRFLIEQASVDVNARTGRKDPTTQEKRKGGTVLWWVYKLNFGNDHEVVKLLKNAGAISVGPGEAFPPNEKEQQAGDSDTQAAYVSPEGEVMKQDDELGKLNEKIVNMQDVHFAAAHGDVDRLEEYLDMDKGWLNEPDGNGWCALHEAVRGGNLGAVQLLLDAGSDINARIGPNHDQHSPLSMAVSMHGHEHPVAELLRSRGAKD